MSISIPAQPSLNRTPEKALRLLMAVAKTPGIRQAMESAGFGAAEVDEGWRLLRAASEPSDGNVPAGPRSDAEVAAANRTILVEGVAYLRRVDAALDRNQPAIAAEVMAGAHAGLNPVLAVDLVIQRLEALTADARPEAAATLAMLESRKLGVEQRRILSEAIATATGRRAAPLPAGDGAASREARHERLIALFRWYTDWSTTARHVVANRHDLIVLGLAKPRRRAESAPAAVEASTAPAPTESAAVKVA
ncbi:hypothetical protein L6V77_33715 [Myxococcota bacterium]|nr:hypothetical protein [Myxococcota bacterium]